MNKSTLRFLASVRLSLTLVAATVLLAGAQASAQVICPVTELTSGLLRPIGITQSNQDNLLVSETGTTALHSGRISIVDLDGHRRTLLDRLPSGMSVKPSVLFSTLALKWMARTELKIGEDGFGFGI